MRLEPDLSRSLVGIGDSHFYGSTTAAQGNRRDYANERAQKLQDRVLGRGAPAGVQHVGDIAEWGLPEEAVNTEAWWAAWDPIPKAVCPGNHDIDNGVGMDTLADWEARYGDRTQVIDTAHFRVVSCLWNGSAQTAPTEGLNHADGYALLLDLINDTTKPTALAFHYALRDSVPGTGPEGYDALTITAAAETNVKNLIANCPNLQLILTGHTHTPPWYATPWWAAPFAGSDGRPVQHHNLGATTYNGNMGNVISPLVAYYFTFRAEHLEVRMLDIANDAWMPRARGFRHVERYEYT